MNPKNTSLLVVISAALASPVQAAVIFASETLSSGNVIYDTPFAGLSRTLNISGEGTSLLELTVSLDIGNAPGETAWNSDLYVQLTSPQGTVAVLLNRPGFTDSDSVGYGDAGIQVNFNDSAANDVHVYQSVSYNLNGSGQLMGTWQSDGRTDATTSIRDKPMSQFTGENPNGNWVLFVADLGNGNLSQINGWAIGGATTAVPEPAALSVLAGLALAGFAWGRRARR